MTDFSKQTEIIDLLTSSEIYQESSKQKQELHCKFVHIKNNDQNIILIGPLQEYRYHAQLVKYYCDKNNILSAWANKPDLYRIQEQNCRVAGGGWMKIIDFIKSIELYGFSTAYGSFDMAFVEKLFSDSVQFSKFKFI